ncbi:hypothetical protein ACHQM5_013258 [Ranunculus cassubicifolius]
MAASLISFPLPNSKLSSIKATATPITTPITTPQLTTQTLDEKFGRKGLKFTDSGYVEMTVRNGSTLSLQISNGHVTSYKPKVHWKDDGFEEILYTVPGEADAIKGGIGLVLNTVSESNPKGSPVCSSDWTVTDVDSDSIDALQVELSCTCGTLELTYIVSLYSVSMAAAVVVKNNGKKAVNLTSAILSYLHFKGRGGTAIKGFKGCSYCSHPPLPSRFELLSPAEAMKSESEGWFSSESQNSKPGVWNVEDQLYTVLHNKLTRVYTTPPSDRLKRFYNTAPSKYETYDQGKGLVFRLIRMGYDDIYISSPGSLSEKFGDEGYFICTGPASMMVPVVVNPGEAWRGALVIEHDNL